MAVVHYSLIQTAGIIGDNYDEVHVVLHVVCFDLGQCNSYMSTYSFVSFRFRASSAWWGRATRVTSIICGILYCLLPTSGSILGALTVWPMYDSTSSSTNTYHRRYRYHRRYDERHFVAYNSSCNSVRTRVPFLFKI